MTAPDRPVGRLVICATPIGNLGDASPRLAESLAGADLILAEDTRRSATLLRSLGVDRPLRSYFAGNEAQRSTELRELLKIGKVVALITDAGTPAISDPGLSAVAVAREVGATVTVVPGPSALTAALAASGLPSDRFVFDGFLPRRGPARADRLSAIASEIRTTVLFVSPHHLLDDLNDLAAIAPDRPLCVARELTKLFEEIQWTTPKDAVTQWQGRAIQGEFTLVLGGGDPVQPDLTEAVEATFAEMKEGTPLSEAVRAIAARSGVSRRALYEEVLARSRGTTP